MNSPADASSVSSSAPEAAPSTSKLPLTTPPPPAAPKPKSGVRAALEYTGIPPSLFEKRPRLPSRNWLIFWSVLATGAGYYVYDRRECKRIRAEYVARVAPLADVPLHTLDLPRKVSVYGAKWPGDEDTDRNLLHFRKYVKPILHAAAIDYDMIGGKRHGDIMERIADEVRAQRRVAAGLDPAPVSPIPLATNRTPEERRARELAGGIILVGRATMKEYFAGLRRGWTDGLGKVDKEAVLAHVLEEDGAFDEPPEEPSNASDDEPTPTPSRPSHTSSPLVFSPLQAQVRALEPKPATPAPEVKEPAVPAALDVPPSAIPPLPPLLLVEHKNRIGFTSIPIMIWEWFNERERVRSGAEAAYRLVQGVSRPFSAPSPAELQAAAAAASANTGSEDDSPRPSLPVTDLDFDLSGEAVYKGSLSKWPAEVDKARAEYYKALPARLETARALARRTREPTKDEETNPPPTEVDLRQERMKKEQRWRGDMAGWDVVRPDAPVAWDERFRNALRVFADPPAESEEKTT